MIKKTKRLFRIYLAGTLLLTCGLIVLRTIALFTGFDREYGYFALHSLPHEIARLATIVGVLLILTMLAPLHGKVEIRRPGAGLPVAFSVALTAILLLAFALFRLFELHPVTLSADIANKQVSLQAVIFCFATVLFAVIAAGSSVFSVAQRQVFNAPHALAAMAVSLATLFYTLFLYFEYSLPMNADVKIASQAAFLSVSVFFLSEARVALGRPMWALYGAVGMISLLLCASVSIPDLIYALVKQTPVFDSAIDDFLLLGFAVYIIAHFSAMTVKPVQAAGGVAGRIIAETEENEAATQDEGENVEQISFFGGNEWRVPEPVRSDLHDEVDDLDDTSIFASPDEEPEPEAKPEPVREAPRKTARTSTKTTTKTTTKTSAARTTAGKTTAKTTAPRSSARTTSAPAKPEPTNKKGGKS